MRAKPKLAIAIVAITLASCGNDIEGTYIDDAGVTEYAFAADGEVKILVLGAIVDAEYRLDDDKVLISSAQGTVVLTRRDDRLYGPMGLELIRQSDNQEGE